MPNRSMSPFDAGVPVSPTILVIWGRTARRALKRLAWWFLKLDSSSMTTMSNGHDLPRVVTSQGMFSRLMTVMNAPRLRASMRSLRVPMAMAMSSPARWSHLASSLGQVSRATRSGAMTRTRETANSSRTRSQMAVRVMTDFPRPMPSRIAATGFSVMIRVACV